MALKEIKPYYFNENGTLCINACCSGGNDDPIRAARLAKKARAGSKKAAKELAALRAEKMYEEDGEAKA